MSETTTNWIPTAATLATVPLRFDLARLGGVNHAIAFDIGKVKTISPWVAERLAQVKPHAGVPRASIQVPLSSADPPTDDLLFESAQTPGQLFYLPRYRVVTTPTHQGEQVRVAMVRHDPGARLTIVIAPYFPDPIRSRAPEAQPLEHEVTAELSFSRRGGIGSLTTIELTDRKQLTEGIELSAWLPTIGERDAVFEALTELSTGAALTVRRRITVAVPAPAPESVPRPLKRWPLLGAPPAIIETPPSVERTLAFDQHHMPDGSVVRIPYIERLVVEPLRIEPTGIKPQRGIFDLANVIGQSHEPTPIATIENTPEPHFRVTTRDLEQILTPHPFTFPKALHPYIYGGITGSGSLGGAALVQVAWQGRHHSYYYNLGRPEVVYYLPDAFKVARVPEAPHTPMLSVGFTSSDGTVASASATVVFAATPVVTAQRLRSAIETIAQRSGVDGGSIVLEPLMADPSRLRLCLALPGAAGATTEILDARIDLRTGLSGGFVLGLDRFRALFDRMHAPNPTLFTGEVEVRLDVADRPAEQIPVLANLADLPGPLLGVEFDLDAASATARITNIIESPVRIRELKVRWGDAPCALEGLSSGTVLAAGSSLVASLTPGSAPDGSDAKPVVTLLDAVVEPDPAAIWAAICEDQSTQVRRSISVNTPVELFSPSGGDTAILEIVVELQAEHGGPVTAASVNAASPRVESFVDFPIADLIVRSLETGAYRYRVTTVRLDRVTVGEWKIATSPILWIVTQDLV